MNGSMATESTLARVARQGLLAIYAREGRREWIGARGHSMRPLIGPSAWMLVEFGPPRVTVGEIVLFRSGAQLVAHRVVGRHRDGRLITKGDSRLIFDPPVRADDIVGVVRAVRRRPGTNGNTTACTGTVALVAAKASVALGMIGLMLRSLLRGTSNR